LVVCSERVVAGGGALGNYLVFDRSPEVRVWEIDQHANAAAQIIAIIGNDTSRKIRGRHSNLK
jgi:hypothetical protein